jgi:hypothetical protein
MRGYWTHAKVMSRWCNLSNAWGFVTVAVQQGDTVRMGRPTPIEGGMTDVCIAEIDQTDKLECIWPYKGMQ